MSGDNLEKSDPLSFIRTEPSVEFRRILFERTSAVLVRRRRQRRALVFAALAASYLAGLATMFVAQSAAGGANERTARIAGGGNDATVQQPEARKRADDSPAAVVRVRRPQNTSHSESLRRLGDTYLLERNDPEGAVRCYQLALKVATTEDALVPTDEGTWLFRALKQDQNVALTLQTEEIHDAKDNS